jgi:hypothetical protein
LGISGLGYRFLLSIGYPRHVADALGIVFFFDGRIR